MPDVFLSYSRDDQPIARRFAEGLQREGFSVWWDQALSAGEAFDKVTEQALDEAKAVVVLWSRKSVDSRWVRAEATQASTRGSLVPVMIESCRRPIMFELTHTADLSGWKGDYGDPDWEAFIEGLRKNVARDATSAAATRDTPATSVHGQLRRRRHRKVGWLATAVTAVAAATLGGLAVSMLSGRESANSAAGVIHLSLPFAELPLRGPVGSRSVALSADGAHIAYAGAKHLTVRALDSADPRLIDIQATNPFFSPDGAWIGYYGEPGALSKVPVNGGVPVLIARFTERPVGAVWSSDGWILFATTAGLFRVSENGGEPELIARPDAERHERLYAWPELLPGNQAVLLTVLFDDAAAPQQIVRLDLATRKTHPVLTGGSGARFVPNGHLLYAADSRLQVIRFDPASGTTHGAAVPLGTIAVAVAPDSGAAQFAVAANGTLVSIAPGTTARMSSLVWTDQKGVETPLAIEPGPYIYAYISPDGQRIAIDSNAGGGRDIWILDLRRSSLTQLTRGPTEDMLPVWNADGSRVYFASDRKGDFDVYSQAADGSDEARLEIAGPGMQGPHSLTPDGRQLVLIQDYRSISVAGTGDTAPKPLLRGDSPFWLSTLSPDGHWIAYESKESGTQTEVFLRPFPGVNTRREKISVNGGRYPRWGGRGGNELYYLSQQGDMMRVSIRFQPELQVGTPTRLFRLQAPPPTITGQRYDISPIDGRFLMVRPETGAGNAPTQMAVVLNWPEELRRIAP